MSQLFNIAKSAINLGQVLWTYKSLATTPQLKLPPPEGARVEHKNETLTATDTVSVITRFTLATISSGLGDQEMLEVETSSIVSGENLKSLFSCNGKDQGHWFSFKITLADLITTSNYFFGVKCTLNTNDDTLKSALMKTFCGQEYYKRLQETGSRYHTHYDYVYFHINKLMEDEVTWLNPTLDHCRKHMPLIKQFEWDNWLPVKLAKASICNYLVDKALKLKDIYSKSQNVSEAGSKFVESLGTIDENGIVIPAIQRKILDVTKNYSENQALGKVIVEATNILFASGKPYDSFVTEIAATGRVLEEAGLSYTDLYSGSFAVV